MSGQSTRAIVVNQTGGPEVLKWQEIELPAPAAGQVLIRHTAIGFNMVDTYVRKGLYPAELPYTPGGEATGIIEDVADGVKGFAAGERIAYVTPPNVLGAYSERRVIDAKYIFKIADGISDDDIAASLLKGLTAWALLRKTYPVKAGENILVYAAAGGVGSILCQWAKHIGARVIGIVGSENKIESARLNGCAEVICRNTQDIVKTVRELTNAKGVPVVYDSLGRETFETSLDCLQKRGLMVSYGNATGPVPPVNILSLMQKGSLFLTRPRFFDYIDLPEELEEAVAELFELIRKGLIKIHIGERFPLADAARAHAAAESAQTVGSTILLPG